MSSSSVSGPETAPKLSFNTHRFIWWLSGFDLDELLHNDEPRRLTSRKFRTRIDHRFSTSHEGLVRHCYWRMNIVNPSSADGPKIRLQSSTHSGIDLLCLIRFFTKRGEHLAGSFFKFGEASRMSEMEFQLSRHLTRDLDRQSRKAKSETLVELILVILADYDDGSKQKLTAQIKQSDANIGGCRSTPSHSLSSVQSSAAVQLPLNGFVQNARRAFEAITQKDGNHFSDVTLCISVEEGEKGDEGSQSPYPALNGTVKFYCHRYLLAQGSPVFAAMFSSDSGSYTENQSREVYIDDVRPEVMKEFLHFLYTGTLENHPGASGNNSGEQTSYKQITVELIHLAEKYQVDSLKQLCELRLLSEVCTERMKLKQAVEDLIRAHCYRLYRLKGILLRLVAWHGDELLSGDAGSPEPNSAAAPPSGDVQERNRLLQDNPSLHTELTQYLAQVCHHGCEELELDSMSDNESSGPSSLSSRSSDSDISQIG